MITTANYHDKTASIDFSTMPEPLRKGHEFVKKATNNGASWDNYHSSDTIKKVVNEYFQKLDNYISKNKKSAAKRAAKPKQEEAHKQAHEPKHDIPGHGPDLVERIPDELRFVRRFVNLNGKSKTKDEILRFINSLQKAILEKKIRKSSPYADEIIYVQDSLIHIYEEMGAKITISIKPDTYEKYKAIANGEKVLASVGFIKKYINLNGKTGMKEKARLLLAQIKRATEQKKMKDHDPYITEVHTIKKNLESFLSEKSIKILEIEKNTLNGLNEIISGCGCHHLGGFDDATDGRPAVMNSMDFADMHFKTLGFRGKWRELIGDPSANFTLMVFGKPKFGKSYLCIDFAGYLARNHGRVLYVAKEEGLDKTLQDKLNDKDVKHPNLYVSSVLPASLSFYDFIFLDSVNRLGLLPEDLNSLKAAYPDKSFIYVFQTTKEGKFRGANTFQHDVDSIIEIPEKGRAVQYGRFNQGGEIPIF